MGLVQQTIEAAQQYWQFRETWREQFVPVLLLHMRMDEWRKLQETLIVIVFHSWLRLRSPRLLLLLLVHWQQQKKNHIRIRLTHCTLRNVNNWTRGRLLDMDQHQQHKKDCPAIPEAATQVLKLISANWNRIEQSEESKWIPPNWGSHSRPRFCPAQKHYTFQ